MQYPVLSALYMMQRCACCACNVQCNACCKRCTPLGSCNYATSPDFDPKSVNTVNGGTFKALHGILDVATVATLFPEQLCNAFDRSVQRKYTRNKYLK